jgi:hypothetical protein
LVGAKPAVKVKPHPILVAVLRQKDAVSIRRIEARSIIVSEVCTTILVVLTQSTVPPQPGKAAFNDPGQTSDLERSLSSLDDP